MTSTAKTLLVLSAFAAIFAASPAMAGPYDKEWTDKCVADNKDEGQTAPVVLAYCKCMVDLMPESETRSVTQWEKSHKREENICGNKAGWKGR